MAVESLCFRITGEYLTRQARTFVLEGDWRRGLQLLDAAFGYDMTGDDKYAVLSASKKLVGTNEVDLVDEDDAAGAAEYLTEVAGLYVGLLQTRRPNGRRVYMRPYAYVTDWCSADMPGLLGTKNVYEGIGYAANKIGVQQATPEARSVRYMDDAVYDRAVSVAIDVEEGDRGGCIGLWKEVDADPPPWIQVPTADRPLSAFQKGTNPRWAASMQAVLDSSWHLERRGGSWLYERDPLLEAQEKAYYEGRWSKTKNLPQPTTTPEAPLISGGTVKALLEKSGLPERVVEKVAEVYEATGEDITPVATEQYALSEQAWITPDGRFWPCRYMQHKYLAVALMRHLHGEELEPMPAEDRASALSWVKLTYGLVEDRPLLVAAGQRVTPEQFLTARLWCEAHNKSASDFSDFFEKEING